MKVVTGGELNVFLTNMYREKFTKTQKEGYYYAQLLRHLELATIVKKHGRNYISLTNYGRLVLRRILGSKDHRETKEILRNVFLNWPPLQVFLKYVFVKGKTSWRNVVEDLGGEMKKWTKILYEVGIKVKGLKETGVQKPFNKFVVKKTYSYPYLNS